MAATNDRFQAAREGATMSVGELAGLAGVERKTIYRIEAGEADPTMRTIRKVSAALGVSPAELIGADE